MGQAPDIKRIAKEDFDAQFQDLISQLAFPINSHMEQVRALFDKGIDYLNIGNQELITLKVQTTNKSVPNTKVTFKSNMKNKVKGIVVVSANITSDNTSFPTQQPFISFSQNLNIVTVNNITGLAPETTYELLLLTIS